MGKSSLCVRFLRSIRDVANKVKTLSLQSLDTRRYFYFDHMHPIGIVARFPIVTYPFFKFKKIILIPIIIGVKIINKRMNNKSRTANIVYVQAGFWW